MALPLTICFPDTRVSASMEGAVHDRAAELIARRPGDVVSCRVVVETEGNRHLTGHDWVVTATLRLPDRVVVAGDHKRHPDLSTALDCTFGKLARLLDERAAA